MVSCSVCVPVLVFRPICSTEVAFCSSLVALCSAVGVFCSGPVVFCSAVENVCSALVGSSPVYSALVGSSSVRSALVGSSSVRSALVGSSSVRFALVGSRSVRSALVGSRSVRSALVGSSSVVSALASCSADFASIHSHSTSTWTWPSVPPPVPPPLHRPPGLYRSVWKPLLGGGGGGGYVTNPVHALPFIHHQRSLTHHIDSCTTRTFAHHHKIQFPSSIGTDVTQLITLITLTPENSHTITITQSHTLYKPWTSSCSLPSIVLRLSLS